MQSEDNLIKINTSIVETFNIAKPKACLFFDGLDAGNANSFVVSEYSKLSETTKSTTLTTEQKAALKAAFDQSSIKDVNIDKIYLVTVKNDISTEDLRTALVKFWLIINHATTDFTTKFGELKENKRVFNLIKDLASAADRADDYAETPEVLPVEIWWNGDVNAHTVLGINYMYRTPELGGSRPVILNWTKDEELTPTERVTVKDKSINDFSKVPLRLEGQDDYSKVLFGKPKLKDGSDLVQDYNILIVEDTLKASAVEIFADGDLDYTDSSRATIKTKLLITFDQLSKSGNVAIESGKAKCEIILPPIKTLSSDLQANRKFKVEGTYHVPSGVEAIEMNYAVSQN